MERTRSLYLPEEVLMEIMSWLPPKCILRLKCVCKSWYELINVLLKHPTFVAKHLLHVNNKILSRRPTFVFRCTVSFSKRFPLGFSDDVYVRLDPWTGDQIGYSCAKFGLPVHNASDPIYHCDGILCVSSHLEKRVSLYNPALNEYRVLLPCLCNDLFFVMATGFGNDSRAKDYKVVRYGFQVFQDNDKIVYRAEIYSLEDDSWREIEVNVGIGGLWIVDDEVMCKGVCYWPVSPQESKPMILSFDLSYEKFCWISLPNTRYPKQKGNFLLSLWNESVALFFHPIQSEISKLPIEIWVLQDYINSSFGGVGGGGAKDKVGSSTSWIKHMTIGPLEGIPTALAFWKSDEILMVTTNKGLVSCNVYTQNLTYFEIPHFNVLESRNLFCLFVESLVSLGNGRRDNLAMK